MLMENTLFVCDCGDINHQMVVSFDSDPGFNTEIWIQIHLTHMPIWKRLKCAVAYIFGYKSNYGAFVEVLLNKEKTKQLIDTLTKHYGDMTDGTF
jgi:hypothetical protein